MFNRIKETAGTAVAFVLAVAFTVVQIGIMVAIYMALGPIARFFLF